jgi:hypothetical protein
MDTPQKPKLRATTVIIVVVFVFIVIFLLLDFHLLSGQANSSSQVSTYSFGLEDGPLPTNQTLVVYVNGSSGLENKLSKRLPDALRGNVLGNTIEVREGEPLPSEGSVLVIDLARFDQLWTPFLGQADIEYKVAYASDGEVDWIDEQSVDLTNASPTIRTRGDYQMSARPYGLMSLMGFRTYLADRMAEQIAQSLQERLMAPNP